MKKHAEVPFSFGVREFGDSKLSGMHADSLLLPYSPKIGSVILRYLQQLAELYQYSLPYVIPVLIILFIIFLVVLFNFVKSAF